MTIDQNHLKKNLLMTKNFNLLLVEETNTGEWAAVKLNKQGQEIETYKMR